MDLNLNNNIIKEQISDVSKMLKLQETAIFCGAGISYNSGLPLAKDLIGYILNVLGVNDSDAEKILCSNLPFESFIQILSDEGSIDSILEIFEKGEPNTNHTLIAELVKLNQVKTILTTNFDMLIEKALIKLGFLEGRDFQVFSTENDFKKIDWNNDIVKIIKIHGSVTDKKEMAITLKLVAKGTKVQNKNEVVKSFFSKSINPNILVLGYSCSDLFDISPQIKSLKDNKSQIIFLEHVFSESENRFESVSINDFNNPFKSFSGSRIYLNADVFIKHLWQNNLSSKYRYLETTILWKENVDKWLFESIEYSFGIKNHLSARLFYDIGEFKLSIKLWEQGLEAAQKENNQLFFYSQLGNIGMALNSIGSYIEAIKCLEVSVKACKEIGNLQGLVSQLQALGNIYKNLREFEKAINVFNEAIKLSEKYESNSLCPSLGNLAAVYNDINNYEMAISILKRGLPIAISIGNKQSEASMLLSFGIAYLKKGEYDIAVSYINKSIILTRQIGDKQGECISLLNLSVLFLQSKDYNKCLVNLELCLSIAIDIKLKHIEAGAYYHIGIVRLLKGEQKLAIFNCNKSIEIYSEILDHNHPHVISAQELLYRAIHFQNSNSTQANLI